ncbi:MAG: mannose-1-phosphate guanylyltransferase [Thermoanaerobaculia bacterium]
MKRAALILAGGAGTRLWPLSSDDYPKQFLRLFDGESLLQRTWKRVAGILPPDAIFISTNDRYRDLCAEQLPELPLQNILCEPARRNTAPAIAFSCFAIEERLGDCTIACLPADHFIADEPEFLRVLGAAFDYAASTDYFVTIGIQPTEPNTGYGYLELGEALDGEVIALRRFAEKPSREKAEEFLLAGNFAWNGGIFVWRSDVFRRELEAAAPEVAQVTAANYESMPSISIDYALMEKAPRVATVRGDFGWSDVGSWAAIAKLSKSAPVHAANAENVFAISGKPVAVVGVSNVVVVDSPNGVLVLSLDQAEALSALVKAMGS